MASHNHQTDYVKRHQSRIKREMYANRLNAFNSPPSSTGSHGTVSDTTGDLTQNLSNFSFNPDDEGTRKLSEVVNNSLPRRITGTTGRFGTRPSTSTNHSNLANNINTSALARSFPEWGTGTVTSTAGDTNTQQPIAQTRPAAKPAVQFARKPAPVTIDDDTKENIPPPSEDTVPLKYLISRRKTRAEMQPRVETPSESSTVLSHTPTQPLPPSRRSRFAKGPKAQSGVDAPLAVAEAHQQRTPPSSSPFNESGLTGPSFLLPSFHHLADLTSGTLKFSTLKNGVPVFVKHGKTRTEFEQPINQHDTIDAVDLPEEEREIFVSMDKIREEVLELQEHDQMVQREAEKLQSEVNRLQTELKRFRQRKVSDSAFGSGSESEQSINRALDAQRNLYDEKIAQLQSRLEQASRQVGINDIHSAALTAERDEALHQASQARERAKRLHNELEASQKDIEVTERYRRERESLEKQNSSLRAANDNLHERNVALSTDLGLKLADLNTVRQELSSVNEELARLKGMYQTLVEEKNMLAEEKSMLAQDHASMERQNQSYFSENKALRSKIDLDARRMSELEQSISRRDQLITELQNNMTTQIVEPAEIQEEYAELLSKVKKLTDQHATEHQKKDEVIQAKDNIIQKQIDHLSRPQEQLADGLVQQREFLEQQRQIIKLKDEILELRRNEATWKREQIKNARMSRDQFTMQNDLENRRQQQKDWAEEKQAMQQEKQSMQQKIDHLQFVLKSVREVNKQVAELNLSTNTINLTEQSTKFTHGRASSRAARYTASELSAKSEALNVDDDPTRQVNMTEQSDFLSVLTGKPVVELKEVNDQPQLRKQHVDHNAAEASANDTVQTIDSDLPSLPGPVHRRSKSEETLTRKQKQPTSILKKSSKYAQDDNTTGALSVRSARSGVSMHSQKSARSYSSGSENMTSAFIIPDITLENARRPSTDDCIAISTKDGRSVIRKASKESLEGRKCQEQCEQTAESLRQTLRTARSRSASRQRQTSATLSREAVSVLDNLCRHKTTNCTVCSRMAPRPNTAHASKTATSESTKKRVTVERPIPVSDRSPEHTTEYTEEPTMRPTMPPGDALAIVLKELDDEARHLEMQMQAKMLELFKLDKATHGRKRKLLRLEYQDLQREYENKTAQIYRLHDVLEGQKRAGQLMTQEEVDVTVASIRGGVEVTQETEKVTDTNATWEGFDPAAFD